MRYKILFFFLAWIPAFSVATRSEAIENLTSRTSREKMRAAIGWFQENGKPADISPLLYSAETAQFASCSEKLLQATLSIDAGITFRELEKRSADNPEARLLYAFLLTEENSSRTFQEEYQLAFRRLKLADYFFTLPPRLMEGRWKFLLRAIPLEVIRENVSPPYLYLALLRDPADSDALQKVTSLSAASLSSMPEDKAVFFAKKIFLMGVNPENFLVHSHAAVEDEAALFLVDTSDTRSANIHIASLRRAWFYRNRVPGQIDAAQLRTICSRDWQSVECMHLFIHKDFSFLAQKLNNSEDIFFFFPFLKQILQHPEFQQDSSFLRRFILYPDSSARIALFQHSPDSLISKKLVLYRILAETENNATARIFMEARLEKLEHAQ